MTTPPDPSPPEQLWRVCWKLPSGRISRGLALYDDDEVAEKLAFRWQCETRAKHWIEPAESAERNSNG